MPGYPVRQPPGLVVGCFSVGTNYSSGGKQRCEALQAEVGQEPRFPTSQKYGNQKRHEE